MPLQRKQKGALPARKRPGGADPRSRPPGPALHHRSPESRPPPLRPRLRTRSPPAGRKWSSSMSRRRRAAGTSRGSTRRRPRPSPSPSPPSPSGRRHRRAGCGSPGGGGAGRGGAHLEVGGGGAEGERDAGLGGDVERQRLPAVPRRGLQTEGSSHPSPLTARGGRPVPGGEVWFGSGGRAGNGVGDGVVWEGDEQEAGPQRQHGGPLGDAIQLDAIRQASVESVCTEWSVSGRVDSRGRVRRASGGRGAEVIPDGPLRHPLR